MTCPKVTWVGRPPKDMRTGFKTCFGVDQAALIVAWLVDERVIEILVENSCKQRPSVFMKPELLLFAVIPLPFTE